MYNIRQWKWLSNNQKQCVDSFMYYLDEIIIQCRQLLKSVFEISSPHKQNIRKVHTFCIFISDKGRTSIQLWHFEVCATLFVIIKYKVATDLGHPYWIYIIPTHDMHQWLLLQFLVLLMMDAESVRNM